MKYPIYHIQHDAYTRIQSLLMTDMRVYQLPSRSLTLLHGRQNISIFIPPPPVNVRICFSRHGPRCSSFRYDIPRLVKTERPLAWSGMTCAGLTCNVYS